MKKENMNIYMLKSANFGEVAESLTPYASTSISNAHKSSEIIRKIFGDAIGLYEECYALYLNNANIAIGYAKISQGGPTHTSADKRLILKYAIETLASGIILTHNHPSGKATPSNSDIMFTEELKKACGLFDISLLDHIIVTPGKETYSFALEQTIED